MAKLILIVDDEEDVRESAKVVLEGVGYNVETAISGDDCLKKLKTLKPDLILLDIMMPGTPIKNILPKIKNVKVVYLSIVRPSDAEREELMGQDNIVDFIQKPYDVKELIKKVGELVK